MKVFRGEVSAGIAEAVANRTSFAYHVPVTADDRVSDSVKGWAKAHRGDGAESYQDDDLFYMKDLLVSVGWNKNDDIFSREQVWAARHSSEDKPLNFEHDRTDVIGHIVSSYAADEAMNPIPEDTEPADLPDKFHVVNGTVVYRILVPKNDAETARAELIEATIAEILEGEWFVSMECYFDGFDYGIEDKDGNHYVVARNDETSWLTKYLAAYPPKKGEVVADRYRASGKFLDRSTGKEYRVGRVLHDVGFSGKGLVRKPANSQSVIFTSASVFNPVSGDPVYLKAGTTATQQSVENPMPETSPELAALQARFDAQTAAFESLKAENDTLKNAGTEATIAGLRTDSESKDGSIASLNAQVATLTTAVSEQTTRATAAETSLATATEELNALKAEKVRADREARVVEKGLDATKAAEIVKNLKALDDAAFASTVEVLAQTWVKSVTPEAAAAAIENAAPEREAALTVASTEEDDTEVADFFASAFITPRRTK